jgi:hypothetical protein
MFTKTRLILSCIAGAFLAGHAGATTVQSTSFSSWQSTLNGSATEANFGQLAYTGYNTSAGITLAGIGDPANQFTFTGPDNGSWSLTGQRYNGILALAGAADTNAGINVAFSGAGQNAFLLAVGSTNNTPLGLTLSDGETFVLSTGVFGFSLSHPITSFFLTTSPTSQPVIDDFYYGVSSVPQDAPTNTPECATILLVLGGVLFLLGAKRKLIPAPAEA